MDLDRYLTESTKEALVKDLKELFSSQEGVKSYYLAKLGADDSLVPTYRERLLKAIHPDERMKGGMDHEKVESIVQELRTPATFRYFVEIALFGVEECSKIAHEFGGADEDFLIYFENLFEEVLKGVQEKGVKQDYEERIRSGVENAFDGFAHYDQLSDLYSIHYGGSG